MYAGADEGLSKSTEIREAYKGEKPNCGGTGGGGWIGGRGVRGCCRIELLGEMVNL